MSEIGRSIPRLDAEDKVTGKAPFSGDLRMPGMLAMKILLAERPHARVLSVNVDKAAAAPGVVGVLTCADVPVNEYGLQIPGDRRD
jgi:CO/xanthine dehydrogenase Mo-binding subunit